MAQRSLLSRLVVTAIAFLLAAMIWLPTVHLFFRQNVTEFRLDGVIAQSTRELASRQLNVWDDPVRRSIEINRMRGSNAEWDFMGRTFFVLSLANMSLIEPAQQRRYLKIVDAIIDETLRLEDEKGMYFFLMNYARRRSYIARPARSTFLDSEIALMLAARQMVAREPRYGPPLAQRIDLLVEYMSKSPSFCGESYPDECWMFDNAVAAAAITLSDSLDGRDHAQFIHTWLRSVKSKLIDPQSGMLISSFTYNGETMDGPEGSSIWMISHMLQIVDPDFANDQYRRARQQIGQSILGFGYAKEWPASWQGHEDIDSGPIMPIVGASAGSSGLAVLGAAAFGDDEFLQQLLTTLEFAAFPERKSGELRYAASNQVGDAVLLYAMVNGPFWKWAAAKPTTEQP
ncbi:MAG TPA: hypothetical protein VHD56_12765 [Tepidisphaeraceae bacterium]|nr:hypothetical protein [Tepidisphaeraceae bacterium]